MTVPPTEALPLLPERAAQDGTRRRLLEVALVQFSERGYHGVSVRDIADAARLSPAGVYVHHASKEALLMELMLLGHEEHRDRLRAAAEQAGDPRQRVRALTRAHVKMHGEFRLLARVCNSELHALSPENRARVEAIRVETEGFFAGTIEEGVRTGVFRARNAWLCVAAIGGMGIRVAEWWTPGSPVPLEEVAETYADFAVSIVAGRDR